MTTTLHPMDSHLQIASTPAGYQLQAVYLASKVFDVGRPDATYPAALAHGARVAELTGKPLLAWGFRIDGPADTDSIRRAARDEYLMGGYPALLEAA